MKLAATILAIALTTASIARADLIEVDYFAPDDRLITLDSESGLQWLDLRQTFRLSVEDVLNGAGGWIAAGFRYATRAEVLALFATAGISTVDGVYRPEDYAPVSRLISLVSCIGCGSVVFSQGYAGPDEAPPGYVYDPGVQLFENTGRAFPGGVSRVTDRLAAGSWLVRESTVPEPSTLALLGLGLVGMAARRRKKV